MTLKEFFQRIPKDGWWMTIDGIIRRGESRKFYNSDCECPISSLEELPAIDFILVAERQGIDSDMRYYIATAADNDCRTPTQVRIRRLLLKHCGLS